MKVRKGDVVQMLSGKDRGKQGRILDARPRDGKVLVENLNVAKRHQKPRPVRDARQMGGAGMTPGGIVDLPMAVPVGNVMLVCPVCHLPTRVGYSTRQISGKTVKMRVCKREGCGQEIDG
jgi:large subunit ribosomal protein L24